MTKTIEVQFHSDMYERAHAAVNVKIYSRFPKTNRLRDFYERIGYTEEQFDQKVNGEMEFMQEIFWQEDVQEIAKECGFSKVYSEGRSSGWAAPFPYIHEEDFKEDTDLLHRFQNFEQQVRQIVDGVDDSLYIILSSNWLEEEKEFLRNHSVAARAIA